MAKSENQEEKLAMLGDIVEVEFVKDTKTTGFKKTDKTTMHRLLAEKMEKAGKVKIVK